MALAELIEEYPSLSMDDSNRHIFQSSVVSIYRVWQPKNARGGTDQVLGALIVFMKRLDGGRDKELPC